MKNLFLFTLLTSLAASYSFADGRFVDSCNDFLNRLSAATGPASREKPVTIQGRAQCSLIVTEMDFERERGVILALKDSETGKTYNFRGVMDALSECQSDRNSLSVKSGFQEEANQPGVYFTQLLTIVALPDGRGLSGALVTIDDEKSGSFACQF